jgi:hypothetical protein
VVGPPFETAFVAPNLLHNPEGYAVSVVTFATHRRDPRKALEFLFELRDLVVFAVSFSIDLPKDLVTMVEEG